MATSSVRPVISRPIAAVLLLIPFLLNAASYFQSSAFLVVGRPVDKLSPEKPRLAPMRTSDSGVYGMLPVVGLAATMGFIAAGRAAVQRRSSGSYNLDTRMPCGEETVMTEEEQATWLKERTAALDELMPMTDQEFLDEVEELAWGWGRHLLPFSDKRRHECADHKRKLILKQKELFKTLRLWHPLALKYPSLMKRFDTAPPSTRENRDFRMNVEYLANEEKIANFTYADFLKETDGLKFTSEQWALPQVGDVVEGTVKVIGEEGAFVEIDSYKVKSWAQVPTKYSSLKPVSSVEEAGVTVGQVIKAAVIETGVRSVVPGDKDAVQYILSLQSIELENAWEKAMAKFNLKEGTDPFFQVTVLKMEMWGASVMTEEGLVGMITNKDLGEKAGDAGLVGAELRVRIFQIREENKDVVNPRMVSDYPIVFSYSSVMKMDLAKKYKIGDVAPAKINQFYPTSMDIEIDGVPFTIRKVDVTSYRKPFELSDIFATDEMIKVYCMDSDESGELRWSIRALEPTPGAIMFRKDKVFEEAEETAKIFFEKQVVERKKMDENLQQTLNSALDDFMENPADSTESKAPPSSVLGDDDDDAGLGF